MEYRITPAGAGKTLSPPVLSALRADHPRRCGENAVRDIQQGKGRGSPPQVRGKRKRLMTYMGRTGITPAGAGKTFRGLRSRTLSGDHPRRCGENDMAMLDEAVGAGSPPQVRGKRGHSDCTAQSRGITPAGAGKTLVRCLLKFLHRDHPRRCGENFDDIQL